MSLSIRQCLPSDRDAAAEAVEKVLAAIDGLRRHPELGRKGRIAGTRELIIAPLVIVYRPKESTIEILAVFHGSRRWPDSF